MATRYARGRPGVPETASASLVGARARRRADPDRAVREALRLPDRRARLELLDRVAAGLERLTAMPRGDRDDHARLPQRHLAGAMEDRQPRHPEALRDLIGDLVEHRDR